MIKTTKISTLDALAKTKHFLSQADSLFEKVSVLFNKTSLLFEKKTGNFSMLEWLQLKKLLLRQSISLINLKFFNSSFA